MPLQIVEFYVILAAMTAVASSLFWRLLIASIIMLVFGYMGETGAMNVTLAFVIGMAGWLYIIYEVFAGEASKAIVAQASKDRTANKFNMSWCREKQDSK